MRLIELVTDMDVDAQVQQQALFVCLICMRPVSKHGSSAVPFAARALPAATARLAVDAVAGEAAAEQIGRASCRERVSR